MTLSCLIFSHLAFYMQWFELFNLNNGMFIQTKQIKNVDIAMTSSSPKSWFRSWLTLCLQYRSFLLDLFLVTCLDKYSPVVSPSLGCSDHSLIHFKIDAKQKTSSDVPFHRTIFQFRTAYNRSTMFWRMLKLAMHTAHSQFKPKLKTKRLCSDEF